MKTIILLVKTNPILPDNSTAYIIGAVIALFIIIYLIYSLIKPEKF
ncbi:MAG: K(+)-transporting ATPase subunit F [Bacteroidetes bacterium]|nr:K(+)-transporting ATPase subunit F [Bacteroidota bacterium]